MHKETDAAKIMNNEIHITKKELIFKRIHTHRKLN